MTLSQARPLPHSFRGDGIGPMVRQSCREPKGGSSMGLGERCDEIVRLIDETLADFGIDPFDSEAHGSASTDVPSPVPMSKARVARVSPLAAPAPAPGRAAAGF
jgi:hypothetical protein